MFKGLWRKCWLEQCEREGEMQELGSERPWGSSPPGLWSTGAGGGGGDEKPWQGFEQSKDMVSRLKSRRHRTGERKTQGGSLLSSSR